MNKHFWLSFLLIFLVSNMLTQAQTYRLEVGYNNLFRKGPKASETFFDAVKIGGTVEYNLEYNFSVLTGALYNVAYSDKIQRYPYSQFVTYSTWGHALEIPVRITYSIPVNKNLKFFAFAGPNISVGIVQNTYAKSKMSATSNIFYNVTPGKTDAYKSSIQRINLQLGAGGGIQWKDYQVKGGYDFGINNLDRVGPGKLYQKGWFSSFAYQF